MIGVKHDTLNCTDQQDKKQGKWVVNMPSLRGEPGYEEEGVFKDNKKEGLWRQYSLMGDLLAIESYKWGFKNGTSRYFNEAGLLREESWKAIDPKYPYDTVKVVDLKDPDKIELKVVKVEGSSEKYGTWKYYDPSTGELYKTEEYVLGQLQSVKNSAQIKTAAAKDTTSAKTTKPQAVLDYEKKNSGKKKIQVRDGSTGY